MIKTLTAIAVAAGLGFAPTPAVAKDYDPKLALQNSAACIVFAQQAGLSDQEEFYFKVAKKIQETSGLSSFEDGFYSGYGTGLATSSGASTKAEWATLFIKNCMFEGQAS